MMPHDNTRLSERRTADDAIVYLNHLSGLMKLVVSPNSSTVPTLGDISVMN